MNSLENMLFICHRINTVHELHSINTEHGVEIDLRDYGIDIVLNHDPFHTQKELFIDFLKAFKHSFLVLNVKSEGIEYHILNLLKEHNITEYFFLDSSFPMMVKLSNITKKLAVRVSEYENYDLEKINTLGLEWIWLDCFSGNFHISESTVMKMKKNGYKICLVSPELHGYKNDKLKALKTHLKTQNIAIDAICCKEYNIKEWQS